MMTRTFQLAALVLLTSTGLSSVGRAAAAAELPEAPDAAMQRVIRGFAQGDGGMLWQALPDSYQRDINALASLAASKVDAELYDGSAALLGRLVSVAGQQQAFILDSLLADAPEPERARWQQAMPALLGLLESLTGSQLAQHGGLDEFNGQQFFEVTVSAIARHAQQLSAQLAPERGLSAYAEVAVSVLAASEAQTTLRLALPNQVAQEMRVTQVDGRWLPVDLAAEWATEVAGARAKLEAISPAELAANKPQVMQMLKVFDGVLGQLEAAQTQAQFDQALQGAMLPVMGLLMIGQGLGAEAPAPHLPAPALPAAPSGAAAAE